MKVSPTTMAYVFGTAAAATAADPMTTLGLGYDEGPMMATVRLPENPAAIINGPGSTLLAGGIISGKVMAIDAITGEITDLVGEQTDRQAWGLWHDEDHDLLLVVGGGQVISRGLPEVYIYDPHTGESLLKCSPPAPEEEATSGGFYNDIMVMDGAAYITDSYSGKLVAMDLADAKAGICTTWEVQLPKNFAHKEGVVQVNGIVLFQDGLLVGSTEDGSVWYLTGIEKGTAGSTVTPSFQQVIDYGGAKSADGLAIVENKLYVSQASFPEVMVFELDMDEATGILAATQLDSFFSPDFTVPCASALYDGYLYTVNSWYPDIQAGLIRNNTLVVTKNKYADEEDSESFLSYAYHALLSFKYSI